jgi:hypothetical protein
LPSPLPVLHFADEFPDFVDHQTGVLAFCPPGFFTGKADTGRLANQLPGRMPKDSFEAGIAALDDAITHKGDANRSTFENQRLLAQQGVHGRGRCALLGHIFVQPDVALGLGLVGLIMLPVM